MNKILIAFLLLHTIAYSYSQIIDCELDPNDSNCMCDSDNPHLTCPIDCELNFNNPNCQCNLATHHNSCPKSDSQASPQILSFNLLSIGEDTITIEIYGKVHSDKFIDFISFEVVYKDEVLVPFKAYYTYYNKRSIAYITDEEFKLIIQAKVQKLPTLQIEEKLIFKYVGIHQEQGLISYFEEYTHDISNHEDSPKIKNIDIDVNSPDIRFEVEVLSIYPLKKISYALYAGHNLVSKHEYDTTKNFQHLEENYYRWKIYDKLLSSFPSAHYRFDDILVTDEKGNQSISVFSSSKYIHNDNSNNDEFLSNSSSYSPSSSQHDESCSCSGDIHEKNLNKGLNDFIVGLLSFFG